MDDIFILDMTINLHKFYIFTTFLTNLLIHGYYAAALTDIVCVMVFENISLLNAIMNRAKS